MEADGLYDVLAVGQDVVCDSPGKQRVTLEYGQAVGGNTARMILSTYSPRELQGIITSGNAVLLKNVKGLGLKTAQKIIVELSGKLTGLAEGDTQAIPSAGGEALDEALSALVMLGFAKAPAEKALRGIMRDNPAVSVEDLVRMALKIL